MEILVLKTIYHRSYSKLLFQQGVSNIPKILPKSVFDNWRNLLYCRL